MFINFDSLLKSQNCELLPQYIVALNSNYAQYMVVKNFSADFLRVRQLFNLAIFTSFK